MASSCRSIWKVLAGQLSVRDTNLLIAEVKACKEKLSSGLDFYKPPSSTTESKLRSTLKGVKLDFIVELSKNLFLDHEQCLDLFEQFLFDDYRGSISDLKIVLSTKSDRTQLCLCVQSYYHQERLYALRCVKHLLGYWQDGSHPFRNVFAECLKIIELESATFTSRLWKQFEACATAEVPGHIVSSEDEMKWLHQNMLEQCELLEMLLLFYKDYEFSPSDLVSKLTMCMKVGFVQHKHRTAQLMHDNLHTHISHLCCLVLLEGIDIEWILQNENRPTEMLNHHLLLPKSLSCLEELLDVLQKTDSAIHTPLLLALMVLKYVSSKEEDVECVQLLGQRALDGGVFEQLLTIMESPLFSGNRPVSEVCRCVVHALLYMVVSLFSEDSLGDLKVLVEIAGKTLHHPTLRIAFWEKGENGAIYTLLRSILKRFPVELGSVISLLQPLAMDQYSAHKLHSLLCRVSWYAESASSHGLEGCVQAGDQEGTVVLTRGKELYKQECFSVGVPSLVFSAGTVGLLIGSEEEEADQIISWAQQYSAWDLLAAITAQLLHTPGVGVDPVGHPIVLSVTLIFELVTELLKHDHSLHVALQPVTGQLTHILTKLSSLPYPPTDLIAACLECAAVMADYDTHHIWSRLSRTRFFPQIIGAAKKAENLQLTPGHYGHVHNVWERAHGLYSVTMAMIQLLQSTINAIHAPDHVTTLSDHVTTDRTVLATAVYVLREGLTTSHGWRYQSHSDREELCKNLLQLCLVILQHGSVETAENSDFNSQNYLYQYVSSLLLHSNGHALLVSILAIGVDTVNELMSSSSMMQCPVAVDTLKLSFTIIDLVLQQDKLPQQQPVSHLEKALATRTITTTASSSQHLIAVIAGYIHHHSDHEVPVGATRLLARLATAATISVYSCLGQEAVAIRDRFINRMSARSENFQLKMAILQFIRSLISTQPGLLELFLCVRTPLDKRSPKEDKSLAEKGAKKEGEQEKPLGYDLTPESCLCAVLSLLDPSNQPPPPPLLSAALSLLHTLWQVRHNTALSALRSSSASFWKNLFNSLFKPPDLQSLKKEDEADVIGCLDSAAHIFKIIATELYYVLQHSVDKGLVEVIGELIKAKFYSKWCQVMCCAKLRVESDEQEEDEGVSAALLSSQQQLAEGWQALLLVAATHHVELFQLSGSGSHRSTILSELLNVISSQASCLPHSIDVLSVLTTTHSVLLHKWNSEMKFTCSTIDQLSGVLEQVCQCDTLTCWQSVLPHLYSILLVVFRTMRGAGGNLEPRFVATLLPPIVSTLLHYPSYSTCLPSDAKHSPETLCVYLLSEMTASLPEGSSAWLQALRHHSLIAMVMRIADELTRNLTRPDLVEAILCYCLSLSSSAVTAEALVVNGLSRVLCLPMSNMVTMKLSSTSESTDLFNGGGVSSRPPMDWFRVWLAALQLVTRLLSTLRHNYLPHALNFIGANQERIAQCLDIFETTRHMDSLNETVSVCSLVQELAHYRQRWRLTLPHLHDTVIEKQLVLLNGTVSLLNKRNNLKHIIKTMDSRGLLPAEVIHEALKVRGKRRSSSGFGQYTFSSDDDSWIICSSAYHQLQDNLLVIMTSCLTTLNHYSPPVSDLFMCSFAHPVDLSAWHSLFRLNFIMDPTGSPSLTTLTQCLTVGTSLLNKLEGHKSSSAHLLSKSPSSSSVSPIRSPNTPGIYLRSSDVSSQQQKRSEILFMLEQAVILLMSQSLKCLLDGEGMNIREKQILRKELISELSHFNQSLLFNFTRKGAPSPLSGHRTSFSVSGQSLQDSVSGRASTHSFSDSIEQGIFKLADSFVKSLNR